MALEGRGGKPESIASADTLVGNTPVAGDSKGPAWGSVGRDANDGPSQLQHSPGSPATYPDKGRAATHKEVTRSIQSNTDWRRGLAMTWD